MYIPDSFSRNLQKPTVGSGLQSIYLHRLPKTGFLCPVELDIRKREKGQELHKTERETKEDGARWEGPSQVPGVSSKSLFFPQKVRSQNHLRVNWSLLSLFLKFQILESVVYLYIQYFGGDEYELPLTHTKTYT